MRLIRVRIILRRVDQSAPSNRSRITSANRLSLPMMSRSERACPAASLSVWIGGKPWGNPFRPWLGEGRRPTAEELAESHARYREHVLGSPDLMARLPELRGKVLACACRPGVPCHGDVLVELLEGGAEGAA